MEYNFDNIIKKVKALSKKARKELENRHIEEGFIAFAYLDVHKDLSGKLSSVKGFVKCVLDSGCMGEFRVSKIDEEKPLDEANIQFESAYTPIFSLYDVKQEDVGNVVRVFSLPLDHKDKVRKVDVNKLQDLSSAVSMARHYFEPFLDAQFDCINRYFSQIDTSLIGKTENTKNLENADKVANIIKEAQELSSRLIELGKAVEDLHVYYS
jgi:hypothetical protein